MNINEPNVTYSSIVAIGEEINRLEFETGDKYLKLHRGVMDVTTIDVDKVANLSFNNKTLQQYSGNDGYEPLVNTIKKEFNLTNHKLIMTPGGMASLDLIINSLSDTNIWVPNYHWGSWNKILKIHDKWIKTFDDFNLIKFKPVIGVVMLCFPSNPTGYCPSLDDIKKFLLYAYTNKITVILDLPYYYLFNDSDDKLSDYFYDNVIVLSSFSESIGLSGYRVGYIATKNESLYKTLKVRSLYKYNSISTIPQVIIDNLLNEKTIVKDYRETTKTHIKNNIDYLNANGLLFDKYPKLPIGPFAIINLTQNELLRYKISSVPLGKFSTNGLVTDNNFSRISVAVDHDIFVEYFNRVKK